MIAINISQEIKSICPEFEFRAVGCKVIYTDYNAALWNEINRYSNSFKARHELSDVNKLTPIKATRMAYKKLGKDPNRYRPSAEALCRRIVKGLELYRINTLVDLINLISIKSSYSIGGFDADKIQGNLTLGVGKANEIFHAIGRGMLNIEGLPVYRDEIGGVGTPTSDAERTKITASTTRLLIIINSYSGKQHLNHTVAYATELLKKYAFATELEIVL